MKWHTMFFGSLLFIGLTVSGTFAQPVSLNTIGGFEGSLPSYWTKGNQPSTSTLSWATDQFRSLGHSLKISKPSTTPDSAAWISENMCDLWSPQHLKNVDIMVGGFVKTQGVNTNPVNADEKWWISYTFWDSAGAFIEETKLPIDQSVATSTGWVADTNGPGETLLPKDSWTTIIKFVAGKNATGTVWAGDFILNGRGGWAGQDWNAGVGVPTGWNYWLPPNGGNDGVLGFGFENTVVTNEAAHSGLYSLKFDLPLGRAAHDAWVGTKRYLLSALADSIKAGDVLRVAMWVKGSNLLPDSQAAHPGSWAIGVTPIFHSGYRPNDPYDEIGAHDDVFTLPNATSFGWTQFYVDVTVPGNPNVKSLSIRPHVYSLFTGTVYYDDVTVQVIGTATGVSGNNGKGIPRTIELANNYPNPFNPTTVIQYATPRADQALLEIYNPLGQRVRTLVQGVISPGYHEAVWDGRNESGQLVQSGVYFYRLRTGETSLVKKMMFIK